MDITEEILKKNQYKEQIDKFSNERLNLIAKDSLKALEEAHKGITQEEPERADDVHYLQAVADGMQRLAQRVLEERKRRVNKNHYKF